MIDSRSLSCIGGTRKRFTEADSDPLVALCRSPTGCGKFWRPSPPPVDGAGQRCGAPTRPAISRHYTGRTAPFLSRPAGRRRVFVGGAPVTCRRTVLTLAVSAGGDQWRLACGASAALATAALLRSVTAPAAGRGSAWRGERRGRVRTRAAGGPADAYLGLWPPVTRTARGCGALTSIGQWCGLTHSAWSCSLLPLSLMALYSDEVLMSYDIR